MKKSIKIFNSLSESKDAELEYISNLGYYDRLKNAMVMIRKVYAKQISENKKSRRIIIISGK